MSKRRINKQQAARIRKIQQTYQESTDNNLDSLADGLVITRYGKLVKLEDNNGKRLRCSIRPNLDTLVAGDRVVWQAEGTHQGVVVSIYPRASMLARPTSSGLKKPVAANITQLIIVIAAKPEMNWPLLDSYLIMAEILHLHAVVLLNKTDLACESLKQELLQHYKPLNYPVIMTNKNELQGFADLKNSLNHQISVFVGQSGVGKSSLISKLLPHEKQIAIQELSESSELGKHTTSNSVYYHLPEGGALIDSPGVREFSLWNMDAEEIMKGYTEFKPYLSLCKFRNCTHIETPECAIINAMQQGAISVKRYNNYIKLYAQFVKNPRLSS